MYDMRDKLCEQLQPYTTEKVRILRGVVDRSCKVVILGVTYLLVC